MPCGSFHTDYFCRLFRSLFVSFAEGCSGEVSYAEACSGEVSSAERCSGEVSSAEGCSGEVSSAEGCSGEVSSAEGCLRRAKKHFHRDSFFVVSFLTQLSRSKSRSRGISIRILFS